MKLSEKYLTKKDIDLANFAKAIALPVRVCIIRLIIENGNEASRVKLHEIPFNQLTVNQHLTELKHLGILRSARRGRMNIFMVNEDVFINMSNNFLSLFEPISQLNEEAKKVILRAPLVKKPKIKPSLPTFGKFVKEKRKQLGLKQEDFAEMIGVDRSTLSRLECDKKSTTSKNLVKIAKALGVPLSELNQIFYQDKMMALKIESEKRLS